MAWKNPFTRKLKEPKRVKPVSEAEVKAKGRKAFAKYRELMEQYRSLQEKSHTKSKLLRALAQWWIKRSMERTNRKLHRKVEKALELNAKYRRQGGEEIRIRKTEHTQLVGGIPPAIIKEIIKAKENAHESRHRIGKPVELHRPVMLRKSSERLAAVAKEAAVSHATHRHAVRKETRQKVRARLESLYKEFRTDPKANKAGVQRAFRPLADYVRTLKSEEAHTQFDLRLREVVKLMNDGKRVEAAHAVSTLSKTIRERMHAGAPASKSQSSSSPAQKPIPSPASKPDSSPAEKPPSIAKKEKSRYEEAADSALEAAKKKRKEKKAPEPINPIQGVATGTTYESALKTSADISKILRDAQAESRLREAGNTGARAQVAEVMSKTMIIYNPATQEELMRLAHKLKAELARDDVGNANNTLQEMAEIAEKVKFKQLEK